jgi:ribosomal protein L7/L12
MDEAALARRLAAIEEQLERLSRAADVPYSRRGALPPEVQELIAEGKTINAIALLRQLQGLTLVEAKNAVDGAG